MKTDFQTGLDVLVHKQPGLLKGRRVGLVSHPAAVTLKLEHATQALLATGINLVALFGPEHGFSASAGDGVPVGTSQDASTGLPVYSLYGELLAPTADMLAQVDVLVFDLQDVGVRFYTYLSTLYHLLQAAADNDCPVVVLDRPNPLTGLRMEGPLLEPGFQSFVGILPIPICHGMTLGELAWLIQAETGTVLDLTVVPLGGWNRRLWFDQTGRTWVPTSPAMPHLSTAQVYPGICLLEGTNLSEGRGTSLPFEIIGAPWVDGNVLAQHINQLRLPGVFMRPTSFIPAASKYQGQVCHGVQLHVLNRDVFSPLQASLELIRSCQKLFPHHFVFLKPQGEGVCHPYFDLLAGSSQLRMDLEMGRGVEDIMDSWQPGLEEFSIRRKPYLLYD